MFTSSQELKGNGQVSLLASQQFRVRLRPRLLPQVLEKGPQLPLAPLFHLHHLHPSKVKGKKWP